uniref:Retrovirus-related Pol polyprotein from transposon TNT 1-94 n=1 Tax=Tanacetum cinerariifolium TaxID=118510 RepID=A0A6L2KPS9_TANCI|nr:retrovirus-related Pol polyprotein from transposon TNT 1-94 [Tanacetum cinerariifolium]
MELALMAKAFKLNYSTPTNNNQRISLNPRNRQIAQPGINMGQDRQMQMVGGNGENQIRQYAGQNTGNLNGYNEVQNVENQVAQNAIHNPIIQNVGNQNGQIIVPRTNRNPNENGNLVAARAEGNATKHNAEEFDLMAAAAELDEIEEVNANCILMENLQQTSTSGTQTDRAPVYDSDGSAEHDPPVVHDSKETLQLAQESRLKMKQLNKEIKLGNFTKINHLSGVFVSQTAKSHEELYFLNTSKTANVSTSISILNEEFSDDTTPSVAREFLNDVKSTIVTLQRVVKHRMTLDTHNWSSSALQELHKIIKDENFPIVNQVDARVQNLKIQFLKEAAKFVGDFKSLAKEADESLAKHKALELEIEHLLKAVKLENKNVELEFQVLNYAKENAHLKTTYKNLFDSISVTRTQTKIIIDSLQNKLHNTIYENTKLRAQLFDTVSDQKDTTRGTSVNTKFAKQSIWRKTPKVGETHALSKPVTSNSIPTPQESKVVKNDKVIAPGMFRINPFMPSREEKHVPNKVRARVKTKPITVSQPPVITKKVVNFDSNGLSSTGVDNTKTRSPQSRSNTKNDRVPFASKSSCSKNKEVDVEEHHRKLLLSRNKKHLSSECNNVKLTTQNVKSKIVCAMCKQCLIFINHNVIQICLWCVDPGCSKHMTENLKLLVNFVWKFLGTVHFENDHVAAILGFGDLQWGNILITMVYFVEGLGHNLFSIRRFCDSDLEVAFRRNTCFVRNLEGVDLLSGNRTTNLYTINLHEMASASLICLMAGVTSTKSWLWHQRLSHLNFDTINDLAKNDLVSGLLKFKYHKEHLCPSCEQEKSKRASHLPKPVLNSRQRLHLLYMDLCGPIRIASINGKQYVLVIVDDYSRYIWVQFLRSKDEAPEAARTMLIFSRAPLFLWTEAIATACFTQNCSIIHRRFNKTPYELINGRKLDISFLHVFGALCYPKNDHEDIRKLGAKAMAFEQSSSKLELQSMTSGQISSGLDLTYASSTITPQQPTEGELDLLFEAMYDDYIGVQSSATLRTVSAAQAHQVRQTSTTSTSIADAAPTPTNSSSRATNFPNSSQDVDGLKTQQQHAQ